ncbi:MULTISPECIES: hypothetical protein [unclassified Variovorax]|uniref:hypothetical protein n=1 Tax=unclassified Variovorax TaxID=663243 RepID=UPI0013A58449|nr:MULTISPECIES: hypothetical protein [unclassified Variovorax]
MATFTSSKQGSQGREKKPSKTGPQIFHAAAVDHCVRLIRAKRLPLMVGAILQRTPKPSPEGQKGR